MIRRALARLLRGWADELSVPTWDATAVPGLLRAIAAALPGDHVTMATCPLCGGYWSPRSQHAHGPADRRAVMGRLAPRPESFPRFDDPSLQAPLVVELSASAIPAGSEAWFRCQEVTN